MMTKAPATLLTGASGYLGSLIAAGLLTQEDRRLILPVRARHSRDSILARIIAELEASGFAVPTAMLDRVVVIPLPPTAEIPTLAGQLRDLGADEIVHAAGCVEYFNTHSLNLGNVDLTRALVELGQALHVRR